MCRPDSTNRHPPRRRQRHHRCCRHRRCWAGRRPGYRHHPCWAKAGRPRATRRPAAKCPRLRSGWKNHYRSGHRANRMRRQRRRQTGRPHRRLNHRIRRHSASHRRNPDCHPRRKHHRWSHRSGRPGCRSSRPGYRRHGMKRKKAKAGRWIRSSRRSIRPACCWMNRPRSPRRSGPKNRRSRRSHPRNRWACSRAWTKTRTADWRSRPSGKRKRSRWRGNARRSSAHAASPATN